MSDGLQYNVHFANGDTHIADSLDVVDLHVMQQTGYDQAPPGLLPAEI